MQKWTFLEIVFREKLNAENQIWISTVFKVIDKRFLHFNWISITRLVVKLGKSYTHGSFLMVQILFKSLKTTF